MLRQHLAQVGGALQSVVVSVRIQIIGKISRIQEVKKMRNKLTLEVEIELEVHKFRSFKC